MGIRSDTYAEYVRGVFRQQSEVSDAILFALDEADPGSERYAELDAADLDILTACRGINELATDRRQGGLAGLKRARQVPECERAAGEAEALLVE